jgi:hypothetical protein
MKWASLIWNFLFDAIKAFLGTDKLEQHEVIHEKAHPATVDTDDHLLDDLRRVHTDRPERESNVPDSGTGQAGEDRKEDGNDSASR